MRRKMLLLAALAISPVCLFLLLADFYLIYNLLMYGIGK